MEFKEILSRLSVPVKQKVNEEELIRNEETNFSEVIINVKIIKNINLFSFHKKIQILFRLDSKQKKKKKTKKVKKY